jgi:hypothetical protein
MASPRDLGLADEASTEGIIALVPTHPLKEQDAKSSKKPLTAYIERESHATMVNLLQVVFCWVAKCLRVSIMEPSYWRYANARGAILQFRLKHYMRM